MRLVSLPGLCVVSFSVAAIAFTACGSSDDKKKKQNEYEAGGDGGAAGASEPTSGAGGKSVGGGGKGGVGGTGGTAGTGMIEGGLGGVPLEPQGGAAGATGLEPLGGAGGDGNVLPFHGLYVSPTGNDTTGDGTSTKPFATLAKVAASAQAGDTIVFLDGLYNPFLGGTLPDGVNVMAQTPGGVTLKGQNGVLFNLAGSSRIEGLITQTYSTVVQFVDGPTADGTVTIVDSKFMQCQTACLSLSGTSKALITMGDGAVLGDGGPNFALLTQQASVNVVGGVIQNFTGGNLFNATDDAVVSLKNTQLKLGTATALLLDKNASGDLNGVTVATGGQGMIHQKGKSTLTVTGSDISSTDQANAYYCFLQEMDGVGTLDITDTKIHTCNTGFKNTIPARLSLTRVEVYDLTFGGIDMGFGAGGELTIRDCSFHDFDYIAIRYGTSASLDTVKIRGTKFLSKAGQMWDTVWLDGSPAGSLDLGTLADPGGNTFENSNVNQVALRNQGTSVYMSAVGNTFMPNLQSADAQGHYVAVGAGAKLEVDNKATAGRNYVVPYNGSKILLAQNP